MALLSGWIANKEKLAICVPIAAELFLGLREREYRKLVLLLDELQCFSIHCVEGELAGGMGEAWARKGKTLHVADLMIAAVAISHGCTLVTYNQKDFPMAEIRLYPEAELQRDK
jgi:predicted nucleic acid-binding protein